MLAPPAPAADADVLVIESTYGDRHHEPHDALVERLGDAVRRTAARGGRVVIPAFAVDRTEVVLALLADLRAADAIPDLPVYGASAARPAESAFVVHGDVPAGTALAGRLRQQLDMVAVVPQRDERVLITRPRQ